MTQVPPLPQRFFPLVALTFLLPVAYLIYSPGLQGPWLLDDSLNILPARLRDLSWAEIRANIFKTELLGGLSRSVGTLTLALSEYLYGADTFPYKNHNLLLHLANGLLVFWLIRLLFRASEEHNDRTASWAALAVTAFWLIHPLQVSSVLYVVQRYALLASFFSLLALCLYLEGRTLAHTRPLTGTLVIATGLALCWPLAVFSKENAVLLVLIVPLIELFFLRLHVENPTEKRLLQVCLGIFVVLPLIVGFTYLLFNFERLTLAYQGRDFTLSERLLTQVHVIWFYIKLIVFPIPGDMSLFHDGFPIQRTLDAITLIAAFGIALWAGLALVLRIRAPLVGFGLIWYLTWHLMESSFLPLELVFEHRNYLALMGLMLALVAGAAKLYASTSLRTGILLSGLGLFALLSLNAAARAFVWSDFTLMVKSEYDSGRRSPRVIEGMIWSETQADRPSQALRYIRELQALIPDQAYPYLYEVVALCDQQENSAAPFGLATTAAAQGRLSPGTTNMTRKVIERVFDRGCPGVTPQDLLRLTDILVANDRYHTANTHLAALSVKLMAEMFAGHVDGAAATAYSLLASAETHSPAQFADAVQAVAAAASLLPTESQALDFLDEATADFAATLERRQVTVTLTLSQAGTSPGGTTVGMPAAATAPESPAMRTEDSP